MPEQLSRFERRKQETRREILGAALACFAERGYHATGIADIVRRVGIAQGTFYLYFQSKREIVEQILDDLMERLSAALLDLPPSAPTSLAEYRDQAEHISTSLTGVLSADPQAARFLLLQAAAVDDDMAERVLAFYDAAAAIQATYLQHGISAGYFRSDLTRATPPEQSMECSWPPPLQPSRPKPRCLRTVSPCCSGNPLLRPGQ